MNRIYIGNTSLHKVWLGQDDLKYVMYTSSLEKKVIIIKRVKINSKHHLSNQFNLRNQSIHKDNLHHPFNCHRASGCSRGMHFNRWPQQLSDISFQPNLKNEVWSYGGWFSQMSYTLCMLQDPILFYLLCNVNFSL